MGTNTRIFFYIFGAYVIIGKKKYISTCYNTNCQSIISKLDDFETI